MFRVITTNIIGETKETELVADNYLEAILAGTKQWAQEHTQSGSVVAFEVQLLDYDTNWETVYNGAIA